MAYHVSNKKQFKNVHCDSTWVVTIQFYVREAHTVICIKKEVFTIVSLSNLTRVGLKDQPIELVLDKKPMQQAMNFLLSRKRHFQYSIITLLGLTTYANECCFE